MNTNPAAPAASTVADTARAWAAAYAEDMNVWDRWDAALRTALRAAQITVTGPREVTVTCNPNATNAASMVLDAGTESVLPFEANAHIADTGEGVAVLTW